MTDQTIEAEPEMGATDYHRRMLKHVKNCGLGFIDNDPQPLGILIRELTDKIAYNAENFGDLLGEAIAARDDALVRLHASVDRAQSTEPTTGTALATIRTSLPTLLAADKDDLLGKLKAEIDGFEPDTSTKKGREQIASIAMKPRRVKAAYKKIAASLKEDAQATIKSVNAEDKQMSELLDGLAVDLRRPLDEIEAAEAAIERDNEAAIKTLEDLAIGLDAMTADEIKQRYLTSRQPFPWAQTFAMRAERTLKGVIAQLQVAHQAAKDREAAIEAERVRQVEEAEAARKATFRLALDEIKRLGEVPPDATSHHIKRLIDLLAERDQDGRDWMEFGTEAIVLIAASATSLRHGLEEAQDREAEVQRIHEAAIAAEATRLAEIEAEHRRQKDAEAAQALLDAAAERERVAKERAARMADQAEATRVASHDTALSVMEKLARPKTINESTAVVAGRLDRLAEIYERNWDEFADEAKTVMDATWSDLTAQHADATEREMKAVIDAKEAQRVRDDAVRLEQEEAAENLKAALETERQRVRDEAAETERLAAKREANVAHQKKINGEVVADILNAMEAVRATVAGGSYEPLKAIAVEIMKAIARKEVRHVGPIQY